MIRRRLLVGSAALIASLAGCAETESADRETGDTDTDTDSDDSDTDTDTNTNSSNSTDSGNGSDGGNGENGENGDSENGDEGDDALVELQSHEWYDDGEFSSGVTGKVKNVSDETLSYVEVSVYFLDADGVQFEEGLANTSDLAADRVWEFDAAFLGDDPSRVEDYEIETSVTNY